MRESAGCPWGGAPIALRPSQGRQTPSLDHLARMGRVWEPRFWERRYRFVRDSARSPRIRGGPGRDTIGHPQPFSLGRSRYSPISTDSSPSASFHRWASRGGCIGAPVTHGPAQLAKPLLPPRSTHAGTDRAVAVAGITRAGSCPRARFRWREYGNSVERCQQTLGFCGLLGRVVREAPPHRAKATKWTHLPIGLRHVETPVPIY